MRRRHLLLAAPAAFAAALCATTAVAGTPRKTAPKPAPIEIKIVDLSERFVEFYNAANQPGVDEAARWKLWKTRYGFAAVPPGAEGDTLARSLLNEAWPRYPEVIDRVIAGYGGMRPSPERLARAAADLLKLDRPMHLRIQAYVGFLEGNAFTVGNRGEVRVSIPLEDAPEHRAINAAHELTHAVHITLGALDIHNEDIDAMASDEFVNIGRGQFYSVFVWPLILIHR